jgi:hypothetical protein
MRSLRKHQTAPAAPRFPGHNPHKACAKEKRPGCRKRLVRIGLGLVESGLDLLGDALVDTTSQ